MLSISTGASIRDYQVFTDSVYGQPNRRHFGVEDMLTNVQRFAMRGIKGIRKDNKEKIIENLAISMSWFMSLMNHLQIDIEETTWRRFPYLCSYCGCLPCACKKNKVESRLEIAIDEAKRPKTIQEFQKMFEVIYPSGGRTLADAGIHLAEEVGELGEAFLVFKGKHSDAAFSNIVLEASDLLPCYLAVFNSLDVDFAAELSKRFAENCHQCKHAPCICNFHDVVSFRS